MQDYRKNSVSPASQRSSTPNYETGGQSGKSFLRTELREQLSQGMLKYMSQKGFEEGTEKHKLDNLDKFFKVENIQEKYSLISGFLGEEPRRESVGGELAAARSVLKAKKTRICLNRQVRSHPFCTQICHSALTEENRTMEIKACGSGCGIGTSARRLWAAPLHHRQKPHQTSVLDSKTVSTSTRFGHTKRQQHWRKPTFG